MRTFVGYATESAETIVEPLLRHLADFCEDKGISIEFVTWQDPSHSKSGIHILDRLKEEVRESDFGIFVHESTDSVKVRGQMYEIARDNVIFETGMFLARFSSDRVFMLTEQGTKVVSDLAGVHRLQFKLGDSAELDEKLKENARIIVEHMASCVPVGRSSIANAASGLGLLPLLDGQKRRSTEIVERIVAPASSAHNPSFFALSNDHCVDAYEGGLGTVKNRFWTTTFFTSGFWSNTGGREMAANADLISRLKKAESPDLRRLFLLPVPQNNFFDREEQIARTARRQLDDAALEHMADRIRNIEASIKIMKAQNFQVKVAHDRDAFRWNACLSDELKSGGHADDAELAIYDRHRVDMYHGGRSGFISRANVFVEEMNGFNAHLESAERYFAEIWEDATEIEEAVIEWRARLHRAKARVDYRSNWLAKYDHGVFRRDRELKKFEIRASIAAISAWLAERDGPSQIRSSLDIGTCTCRYPIELQAEGFFDDDALICAVDEDPDCIAFSEAKIVDAALDEKIMLVEADFLSTSHPEIEHGEFELITCMMGTVSHFGNLECGSDFERSGVQRALNRMYKVLQPEGLLLVGMWSDSAIRSAEFLRIYTDADAQVLQRWSPTVDQLSVAAARAGFIKFESPAFRANPKSVGPNPGLVVYALTKPKAG